jgi:predicted DNA-binding transcriptional regulator AlpA
MPTLNEDARDREHFAHMAEQEEISRRFRRLNARATLDLLEALEHDAERGKRSANLPTAIEAIKPLLPAALAAALAGTGDPDELVSLRRAGEMIGVEYRVLGRLVRQGTSPIPVVLAGRNPKFRRADVEKLLGGDAVPPPESPGGRLAQALREAMPAAQASRALIRLEEAAARLGMRPGPFHGLVRRGKVGLPVVKLGVRFFFRPSDVEAHLAAAATKSNVPESTNAEAARTTHDRRTKKENPR